jgi:hypothetical protein
MNVHTIIPQLFYDLIGRLIPGAFLVGLFVILFYGPVTGLQYLTTWTGDPPGIKVSTSFVLLGNLLIAYILASLLGGLWFFISPIFWGKKGKDFLAQEFIDRPLPEALLRRPSLEALSKLHVNTMKFPGAIAFMYDYIQLRCPKAGSRIVKLRAEQHMSGVLMVGFCILALLYLVPMLRQRSTWSAFIVEPILLVAASTAGYLAWHLEKRSSTALYNYWFLVWSGIAKEESSLNWVKLKEE